MIDNILSIILITVLISIVLNVLLKKIQIPTVIGYIFAGTIITHLFELHDAKHSQALHILAEFGIVFLMFMIGLEFSIKHLKAMKREVFLFGVLEVLIVGNFFGAFAHEILKVELKSAIIIGFALALSSTAIVLKMLTEKNEIHSGFGRVVVGVLLFQDIAVIPILLMISIFSNQDQSIATMLLWTAIDAIGLLIILYLIGQYLLEPFLEWTLSAESEEIFLISALIIVVGFAYLAHLFGFSFSLGAFLAGMTLSETKFKYRIESDLLTFRDILLGVFFVSIGMSIELQTLINSWWIILLLVFGVMITKAIIIFFSLLPFTQKRTALKSALSLMQIGEFALAIFALATQNSILDPKLSQILIITTVLSMIITPFIIINLKKIADKIYDNTSHIEPPEITSDGYKNHIILIGFGPLGQKLSTELEKLHVPYIILEHDYKLLQKARKEDKPVILAKATDINTLKSFGVESALAVIVAIQNPATTRIIVDALTSINKETNIVVAVKNPSQKEILKSFNSPNLSMVDTLELLSKEILKRVLKCDIKKAKNV
jgi:CPA2 family monovalent cation:H+ antiporter-2